MLNFVKPVQKKQNLISRAAQAVRYTITGVAPDAWMSPLNPLPPFSPVQQPWQWDRPVGYNITYKPRGSQEYSFDDLRSVARRSELVRLAIETRQDQVSAINWLIKPILENEDDEADDDDPRLQEVTDFFRHPDKIHDWDQWSRMVLEELFVTDAVSLAKRKTKGGKLYALEPVDGATIFPLVDQNGRQPLPPDPAYQQILKGVPKADYSSDELIYYVRKTRVFTPYGFSPVEQVIESAQTDIERAKYTLAYFSEGSVPDAYMTAPDGMTIDAVLTYETHLNGLLAGNAAGRRQMPVLPHGMEIHNLKQAELKNEFDEWLARKICFAFSLPPTAFIKANNRATAESEKDRATEEGLFPILLYIKRLCDKVIQEDFGYKDLEFHWDADEERDPSVQATIDQVYVNAGIMSRNEVRDALGLDNIEGGDEPLVTTGSGLVPLPGSDLDVQQKQEQLEQQQASAAQAHENNMALVQAKGKGGNDNEPGGGDVNKRSKKKLSYGASHSH